MSEDLALDFKSATLYAVRLVLHSADPARLDQALAQRMKDAGGFFENEPVVIDASRLGEEIVDWPRLLAALQSHKLPVIGVVAEGGNLESARKAGLTPVELPAALPRAAAADATETVTSGASASEFAGVTGSGATGSGTTESSATSATEQTSPATLQTALPTAADQAAQNSPDASSGQAQAPATLVVNRPLRSGQRIYARGTDLVVIGMVSQGAEVIADGNVHVYGPLRGKAMAGARGDVSARIFTTQLDPELLAVAGVYRVVENKLDASVHGKPALVRLQGETLKIEALDT